MKAVFSSTLPDTATEKSIRLFYIAEMHGLDSSCKYIEVKTHKYRLFDGPQFQTKVLRWWIQNALVGVSDMVIGLRTNKGQVFQLQKTNIHLLQRACTDWEGDVCLNAVQHILNNIREKYDELVKPGEILCIEKKPSVSTVKFSIIKDEKVLSSEFKDRFSTTSTV